VGKAQLGKESKTGMIFRVVEYSGEGNTIDDDDELNHHTKQQKEITVSNNTAPHP